MPCRMSLQVCFHFRSKNCRHLQCFDAETFLALNAHLKICQTKWAWTCPVCSIKIPVKFLVEDKYFSDVLASKDLPGNANEIILVNVRLGITQCDQIGRLGCVLEP